MAKPLRKIRKYYKKQKKKKDKIMKCMKSLWGEKWRLCSISKNVSNYPCCLNVYKFVSLSLALPALYVQNDRKFRFS